MAKTALQLYSLRHMTPTDMVGTIQTVARMGFEGIEFAGYFGMDAKELKKVMDDAGLAPMGSHTGIDALENNLEETIDYCLTLGQEYIVCPGIPTHYCNSRDAWLRTAEMFNRIGEKVVAAGMTFGYHNHSYEFEMFDGQFGLDILFSNTSPEYVKMELDTCWAENAGVKSVDFMAKYPKHFKLLHIKDLAGIGKGHEHVIIGEGIVDFPAICSLGKKMGCPWFIIEHEHTQGDVVADIQKGLDYLKTLL